MKHLLFSISLFFLSFGSFAQSKFDSFSYRKSNDTCQRVIADLDTFFVKYDTLGNISNHLIKTITDSVYSSLDSTWSYRTYRTVDFCEGDLIALVAKPQFPDNDNQYHQSMNN